MNIFNVFKGKLTYIGIISLVLSWITSRFFGFDVTEEEVRGIWDQASPVLSNVLAVFGTVAGLWGRKRQDTADYHA